MLSIAILIFLIIIPALFTFFQLSKEISNMDFAGINESIVEIDDYIRKEHAINLNLSNEYESFKIYINNTIRDTLYYDVPKFAFNIFIILFFFYYFLKNYDRDGNYIKSFFDRNTLNKWNKNFKELIYGIIYGQIIVRLVQVGIGITLLWIIGVKNIFVWGIIMFFTSFLPVIGTGFVTIPLFIISFIAKNYEMALYIAIIGIIISFIDNLIMPYIISEMTNMGPIVTLISILGGIQFFGIYGIILGPFFLGLLIILIKEFIVKLREDNDKMKRYIWTDEERKKFRQLKTDIGRDEFIRMLHQKYEKEEMIHPENVKFR